MERGIFFRVRSGGAKATGRIRELLGGRAMELENRADWGREERAERVVQVIGTAGVRTGRKESEQLLGERAGGPTETKNRRGPADRNRRAWGPRVNNLSEFTWHFLPLVFPPSHHEAGPAVRTALEPTNPCRAPGDSGEE